MKTIDALLEMLWQQKIIELPLVEVWLIPWLHQGEIYTVPTTNTLRGYLEDTEAVFFMGEELFAELASDIFAAYTPVFRPRGIRVTEESNAPTPA